MIVLNIAYAAMVKAAVVLLTLYVLIGIGLWLLMNKLFGKVK